MLTVDDSGRARACTLRRCGRESGTPTGSTRCASTSSIIEGGADAFGPEAEGRRRLLRPALHPEARVRVRGPARPQVTFGKSRFPYEGEHRKGEPPVVYDIADTPGTAEGLATRGRSAVEREVHARARRVHRGRPSGARPASSRWRAHETRRRKADAVRARRGRADRHQPPRSARPRREAPSSWRSSTRARGAAEAVAEQKRVRWFEDYRNPELLDLVDAVIICTPPNLHYEIARHFLSNGKHVLCEKPLTIASAHAEELVRAAEEHELRADDGVEVSLRRRHHQGQGDPRGGHSRPGHPLREHLLRQSHDEGPLERVARDWRAAACSSTTAPTRSTSRATCSVPSRRCRRRAAFAAQALEVEDTARLQFRTQAGVIGHDRSQLEHQQGGRQLHQRVRLGRDAARRLEGRELQAGRQLALGPLRRRVRQDRRARRSSSRTSSARSGAREKPLITPEDALASVRAIETAYVSTRQNNWVTVGSAT